MNTIISQLPDRESFLDGKDTVAIGYPWLTYGAIIAIEGLIKPEHNVLEFGCGGSTVFFSSRCHQVKSYELRMRWIEIVKRKLPNPSNVTFMHGRPRLLLNNVSREKDEFYDWLIVDMGGSYRLRRWMMGRGIPKLKKGGYMVVDNYAQEELSKLDYSHWDVYTFDDFGYGGKGTKIAVKP